jgi:16S rRNA (uracil1498-N3)-methyltransferase
MGLYNGKENMNHFFIKPEQLEDKRITVTGDDAHHIKNVLRAKRGEELSFSDGTRAATYRAIVSDIGADTVSFELLYVLENEVELPAAITLFQALPKADKMDLIVQKAVELGVTKIVPVAAARSVVRLDEKKAAARIARWQAISEAAAKQSQREYVPQIGEVASFSDAVKIAATMDFALIPYELATGGMSQTKEIVRQIKAGQSVAVFVGPEGGFSETEIALATESGATPITMGKRILRTETAGLVMLAWLMYQLEE